MDKKYVCNVFIDKTVNSISGCSSSSMTPYDVFSPNESNLMNADHMSAIWTHAMVGFHG